MEREFLLTKGFTQEQAEILSAAFSSYELIEDGAYFLHKGHICKRIALITSGMCRYLYHTEKEEVTRWISLKGDFMTSLGSFINQKPSFEAIQAIRPTEIYFIHLENWELLKSKHPFILHFWNRTIEQNYIGMEERLFVTIAKTAEERYHWLLENYPRFNQEVPDKYIASMLGITPRHLSRIRAQRH
ncbi:MAG: Crp/Fnr family transcriptional regulator [Lunatimonas sp.]|uniref:Crp/Fnr family transcriptional regulator n=1 Tax=Lunatimonas sp. TaxID=2060141 RepID=UPI00263ACDA3|nr:Crp/Fnr family transcriptional regulator [Lunatimonas sp.]MCC5938681.1 Crp/Fnr family transcriptional regulator [Lunatimonas sp.]